MEEQSTIHFKIKLYKVPILEQNLNSIDANIKIFSHLLLDLILQQITIVGTASGIATLGVGAQIF